MNPQDTSLDPRRWWVLALLCGAFFMVILDASIVFVALPSIGGDLGFSDQGLQWVVSAYALTFGGLLLLGGRAADLLGRRRVFMVGLVVFASASLLCGLAWSPAGLLAARAIQGVGAAIMTPTALSIISTTFPEGPERNKALGIWGMLGGLGATAGWLIGGPLVTDPAGSGSSSSTSRSAWWRCLSPALLHESRGALARRSYDPAGAVTITGALGLLVYALVEAPDVGWGAAQTILLVAGSAVLLAAFVLIESRHDAPLLPLRLLRSRTLVGANLVMLLFGTVAFGMPLILTLYAQEVLGYSALEFGAGTAVVAVAAAVGSIVGQAAVLKVGLQAGRRARHDADGCRLAPAHAGVRGRQLLRRHLRRVARVRARASASPSSRPPSPRWRGRRRAQSGLASGLSNTAFQVGQALGVAIASTVAVSGSEDYLAAHEGANPLVVLTEGFQSAFVACAVLAGIAVVLALTLLGVPRKARQEALQALPATGSAN